MKREVRNCQYCGREYEPIRWDQKFCQRDCLDRWFLEERKEALKAWRAQRRLASFFGTTVQLPDDADDDDNQYLREAG
jgi:hypothetical protein